MSNILNAILKEDTEKVRILLEDPQINPNGCNDVGESLLHIIIKLANLQILDLLLAHKDTNLDIQNNLRRETPLCLAVLHKNFEGAKRLIQAGADVNIPDVNNSTPIHMAVESENLPILELMLSHRNVEVDRKNNNNQTPLYTAVKRGHYDLVERLVGAGADINYSCSASDETPLDAALGHPRILHFFLPHIPNLDETDKKGKTLLHKAVMNQNLESVCMLLYYNIDVGVVDVDKHTAFHCALQTGNEEIQDALYEYIADVITDHEYSSCLQLALENFSPLVDAIILKGAHVDKYSFEYLLTNWTFKEDIFKIVWERIEDPECLDRIIDLNIEIDLIRKILPIVIKSPNINIFLRYISACDYLEYLIREFIRNCHPSSGLLTELLYRIFEHSYVPTAGEIYLLYFYYDYCDLLKLLRYIEYRYGWSACKLKVQSIIMPRLIFDVHTTIKDIENDYLKLFDVDLLEQIEYKRDIEHYFGFFANRHLMATCGYNFAEDVLPKVPTLVELARNATREFVVEAFKVTSTCQYYTIIDHCLNIPFVCKSMLKFEKKLYHIHL